MAGSDGGQVDEVRRVRVIGSDAGLGDQALEFLDLLVGVLRVLPALRRAEEDLHAFGTERLRARHARGQSTRGRDMSTQRHF